MKFKSFSAAGLTGSLLPARIPGHYKFPGSPKPTASKPTNPKPTISEPTTLKADKSNAGYLKAGKPKADYSKPDNLKAGNYQRRQISKPEKLKAGNNTVLSQSQRSEVTIGSTGAAIQADSEIPSLLRRPVNRVVRCLQS